MKAPSRFTPMRVSIVFSFIYLLTYSMLSVANASLQIMLAFFVGSPFVVLWVVISILRDKHQPDKTFENHFYQKK